MNLDTSHLKLKIRAGIAANERRQAEMRDELLRLEKEVERMKQSLLTVDAIERIAEEFQMPAEEPLWTPGAPPKSPEPAKPFHMPSLEETDPKPAETPREESKPFEFESDLNFNRWG
jgi:hypothetical protein